MSVKVERSTVTVASLVIAALVVAGFAVNYWLALRAVRVSDRQWCTTLNLLHHQLPARAPLRPLIDRLRSRFGC